MADFIPMIRARGCKRVVRLTLLGLGKQITRHHLRRPASERMVVHCLYRSISIKLHSQALNGRRAHRIETRIIFPREDHFYRTTERFGCKRLRHRVIPIQPTTETAAEQIAAHQNFALRYAESFGDGRKDQALPLVARMDLEYATVLEGQRVDRF
jgi:hypothetical protein